MGTRSNIAMLDNDKFVVTYCHWDGYVSGGVGETLLKHYGDEASATALCYLGYASGVFDTMEETAELAVNKGIAPELYASKEAWIESFDEDSSWIEYFYVAVPTGDGKVTWFVTENLNQPFELLAERFASEQAEKMERQAA